MLIIISDCIKIWQKTNPLLDSCKSMAQNGMSSPSLESFLSSFCLNMEFICVKERWFRSVFPSELCRARGEKDGKYHYIYIQINMETGEFYIGKSNKLRWSEVKRYQGSGLRFKHEFDKHSDLFVRYFLAVCDTAEETERLESELVDEELLQDEKCLNLVAGGGGAPRSHKNDEERRKKLRAYNKAHPERFSAMIEKAKKLYHSGGTPELEERSRRIKATMSTDQYREMRSMLCAYLRYNVQKRAVGIMQKP